MALPNTTAQIAAAAKKANREREATQAMREYQAEQARVEANTARLRALRLAKEATDAAAEAAVVKKPAARVAARSRNSA